MVLIFNIISLISFIIYVCIINKLFKDYKDRNKEAIKIIEKFRNGIITKEKNYIERNRLVNMLTGVLYMLKKEGK